MSGNGLTRFIFALGRAILSLGYWLLVFFCFYGAVAGDRRSDASPLTPWQTYAVPVGIIVLAVLIHASLSLAWASRRRMEVA